MYKSKGIPIVDFIKGKLVDPTGEYDKTTTAISNEWVEEQVLVTTVLSEDPDIFLFVTRDDIPLLGFVLDSSIFLNENQSNKDLLETLAHELEHLEDFLD